MLIFSCIIVITPKMSHRNPFLYEIIIYSNCYDKTNTKLGSLLNQLKRYYSIVVRALINEVIDKILRYRD